MNDTLISLLQGIRLIAVIRIEDPDKAVPLCHSLLEGGVKAIELTLRTPKALKAIAITGKKVPGMLLGAGTVLTREQLYEVQGAGARFAVAPGFNPVIVEEAEKTGLPFAPGVMTPSEMEQAWALGCRVQKFYHAELAGGPRGLQSLTDPFAHLDLKFIPLGGVDQDNLAKWAAVPSVIAIGGSWIAPADLIDSADWSQITARAAAAVDIINSSV